MEYCQTDETEVMDERMTLVFYQKINIEENFCLSGSKGWLCNGKI